MFQIFAFHSGNNLEEGNVSAPEPGIYSMCFIHLIIYISFNFFDARVFNILLSSHYFVSSVFRIPLSHNLFDFRVRIIPCYGEFILQEQPG